MAEHVLLSFARHFALSFELVVLARCTDDAMRAWVGEKLRRIVKLLADEAVN